LHTRLFQESHLHFSGLPALVLGLLLDTLENIQFPALVKVGFSGRIDPKVGNPTFIRVAVDKVCFGHIRRAFRADGDGTGPVTRMAVADR
jgi:hypothetical protein